MAGVANLSGGEAEVPEIYCSNAGLLAIVGNRPFVSSAIGGTMSDAGFGITDHNFDVTWQHLNEQRPSIECAVIDVSGDPVAAAEVCVALRRSAGRELSLILLITGDTEIASVTMTAMVECRPAGVLGPGTTTNEMVDVVRLVLRGQIVYHLDRALNTGDLVSQVWRDANSTPVPVLTDEDKRYLRLIAQGMPDCRIAERLFVSEATVRRRVSVLRRRTGTGSRTELAAWCGAFGLYQTRP